MPAKTQKGFTLIELVMVIVIIGILAAVAIPQFVNLSSQAQDATARGTLGTLRSANAIVFSNRLINGTLGAFTMGDIVAGANLQGVTYAMGPLTILVTISGGATYPFTLAPTDLVPTTLGTIRAAVVTW